MKTLVKSKAEPGLWLKEVEKPIINPYEVLIKVKQAGICGTDLHIYNWDNWAAQNIAIPTIIGHEFFGEIVEIAASNIYKLPDTISDNIATILDPIGNAVHTVLSFNLVGADVLITGAGPIGLMATAISRYIGARNIVTTDINDFRLNLAKKMGASKTINNNNQKIENIISELNMQGGFDVGLELSGNINALNDLLDNMYQGGKIALLGIPNQTANLDLHKIIFKELTPIITHEFNFDNYEQAFITAHNHNSGKVILKL